MDQYTDMQILAELVRRNKQRATSSPNTRRYATEHVDICIGIGRDHTADVTMDVESMAELERLAQ